MFFGFSAPKLGGVLVKTFSKPSFNHSFQKMAPRGGAYQISPDVALTTCIHLYSKSTHVVRCPEIGVELCSVRNGKLWVNLGN